MKVEIFNGDVSELYSLIDEWIAALSNKEFNVTFDKDSYVRDVRDLINRDNADMLVIRHPEAGIVGLMGIVSFRSPFSDEKWASEHYCYIKRDHRDSHGFDALLNVADKWSKRMGCKKLILNASVLANRRHDLVCRLYERKGYKHFETSFIKEL